MLKDAAWKFSTDQGCCGLCERAFQAEERHMAALMEPSPAGECPSRCEDGAVYRRVDVCDACWAAELAKEGGTAWWLAHWCTTWSPPEAGKPVFNKATALDLFRRSSVDSPRDGGDDDARFDQRMRLRYVLALLLMRKRVLKYVDSRVEDGREHMLLREAGTDTEHLVLNPQVQEDDADALADEIASVFGWS